MNTHSMKRKAVFIILLAVLIQCFLQEYGTWECFESIARAEADNRRQLSWEKCCQFDSQYLNAHMLNLAIGFSKDENILDEASFLLHENGYLSKSTASEKKVLKAAQQYCADKGMTWENVISIPLLFSLYDGVDQSGSSDACEIRRKKQWGRILWNDGSFYMGQMSENMDMVNGVYYYGSSEDALYWGQFSNDKRNGKGVILYNNLDCYFGNWKNDRMNLTGTYYFAGQESKEYYCGNWNDGTMSGPGVYAFPDQTSQIIGQTSADTVPLRIGFALKQAKIRVNPHKDSRSVGSLKVFDIVHVSVPFFDPEGDLWYCVVKQDGTTGFLRSDCLSEQEEQYNGTVSRKASLRQSPDEDSTLVATLKKGLKVTILSASQDQGMLTWLYVQTDKGLTGYVRHDFLRIKVQD